MQTSQRPALSQFSEIGQGFSLEEAVALVNHEVMKRQDRHKPTSLENIGLISGLSTFSNEIELTISFFDHQEIATKSVFEANYLKIT